MGSLLSTSNAPSNATTTMPNGTVAAIATSSGGAPANATPNSTDAAAAAAAASATSSVAKADVMDATKTAAGGGGAGFMIAPSGRRYEYPPNLRKIKPIDHFKLNTLTRNIMNKPIFLKKMQRTIEFVQATQDDHSMVAEYVMDVIRQTEPMDVASGITPDYHWGPSEAQHWLDDGIVYLATDCGRVCALASATPHKVDTTNRRPLVLRDDYGPQFAKREERTEPLRVVYLVDAEIKSYASSGVPDGVTQYYNIDFISVRPDYQGNGLAMTLWKHAVRHAVRNGYPHVSIVTTGKGSNRIAEKYGMRSIMYMPWSKFIINGKQRFPSIMYDQSTQIDFMIGDMSDSFLLRDDDLPKRDVDTKAAAKS